MGGYWRAGCLAAELSHVFELVVTKKRLKSRVYLTILYFIFYATVSISPDLCFGKGTVCVADSDCGAREAEYHSEISLHFI